MEVLFRQQRYTDTVCSTQFIVCYFDHSLRFGHTLQFSKRTEEPCMTHLYPVIIAYVGFVFLHITLIGLWRSSHLTSV